LIACAVKDAGLGRGIAGRGLDTGVVNGEFLEVREDGKRQLSRPCIAPELIGRGDVALDVHGRLSRFEEEFPLAMQGEGIVRSLHMRPDLDRILMDHIAVLRGKAL
jgi:hypothetical protein